MKSKILTLVTKRELWKISGSPYSYDHFCKNYTPAVEQSLTNLPEVIELLKDRTVYPKQVQLRNIFDTHGIQNVCLLCNLPYSTTYRQIQNATLTCETAHKILEVFSE
jgi:hypothetical protein